MYGVFAHATLRFPTLITSFHLSEHRFHQPNRSPIPQSAILYPKHTSVHQGPNSANTPPKCVETSCKNQKWIISPHDREKLSQRCWLCETHISTHLRMKITLIIPAFTCSALAHTGRSFNLDFPGFLRIRWCLL